MSGPKQSTSSSEVTVREDPSTTSCVTPSQGVGSHREATIIEVTDSASPAAVALAAGFEVDSWQLREGAQAVFTRGDPKTSLVRCFAGLLAVLALLPDSIKPHLRRAYNHSIIFTPDHPHYNELTVDERNHLSGARADMELARIYASQIQPNGAESVKQRLRDAEQEARTLVLECRSLISMVAEDIVAWGTDPDTDSTPMALYPPERAKGIVCRREQNLNAH